MPVCQIFFAPSSDGAKQVSQHVSQSSVDNRLIDNTLIMCNIYNQHRTPRGGAAENEQRWWFISDRKLRPNFGGRATARRGWRSGCTATAPTCITSSSVRASTRFCCNASGRYSSVTSLCCIALKEEIVWITPAPRTQVPKIMLQKRSIICNNRVNRKNSISNNFADCYESWSRFGIIETAHYYLLLAGLVL